MAAVLVGCSRTERGELGASSIAYPELASGHLGGFDWSLYGEQEGDDVCWQVQFRTSGSAGGGSRCEAAPASDGFAYHQGGSQSGDEELRRVDGVVGADVAAIEFVPARDVEETDLVWIEGQAGLKLVALVYPLSYSPSSVRLLDRDGRLLRSVELFSEEDA